MRFGRLPIDEQVEKFRAALASNRTLMNVLDLAAGLDLPGWYLLAGCLYQAKVTRWQRQWPALTVLPWSG